MWFVSEMDTEEKHQEKTGFWEMFANFGLLLSGVKEVGRWAVGESSSTFEWTPEGIRKEYIKKIDEELRNFGRNNQLGFNMDSHLDDSGEVRNESQESLSTKE